MLVKVTNGYTSPQGTSRHSEWNTQQMFWFHLVAQVMSTDNLDAPFASWGPFYQGDLTVIPAWTSNHMIGNVWDEITYPFPNFNGCTVDV